MDKFLHSVVDDDFPTFNYDVGDLTRCLYNDNAGDALDVPQDYARDDA